MNTETRILIVENDQDLRDSMVECLRLARLTVSSAGSAAECYQTLASHEWCVAVVDIDLPDQSGYVLVEYIRANTDMKVIILTARDAIDERIKGYDSGADIYLVKPINCRELATAITSLTQRRCNKTDPPVLHSHNPKSGHLSKAPHPARPT
jgi:two-component system, OmpR family, response regulator